MKLVLTLAIPAYNMEKYLSRCLDSVLTPEIEDNVEILLINDGSKDNTLSIARDYESKFPNILRVIDKPNGGWGSGINRAVSEAKGKYFRILDSDDWFNTSSFIQYVHLLNSVDSDIIVTAHKEVYNDGGETTFEYETNQCDRILDFNMYLRNKDYKHGLNLSNTTLRTELLTDEIAKRFYADIEYIMRPLAKVKTIFFTNINLYRYYRGRDEQSTSIKGYIAHADDFMLMLDRLIGHYEAIKGKISESIRIMYETDYSGLVSFGINLHLNPKYNGGSAEKLEKLKNFDTKLKTTSPTLYALSGKKKTRKFVPYIKIWRTTGINIFKLRFWT